jgi:hypothetical protein
MAPGDPLDERRYNVRKVEDGESIKRAIPGHWQSRLMLREPKGASPKA